MSDAEDDDNKTLYQEVRVKTSSTIMVRQVRDHNVLLQIFIGSKRITSLDLQMFSEDKLPRNADDIPELLPSSHPAVLAGMKFIGDLLEKLRKNEISESDFKQEKVRLVSEIERAQAVNKKAMQIRAAPRPEADVQTKKKVKIEADEKGQDANDNSGGDKSVGKNSKQLEPENEPNSR